MTEYKILLEYLAKLEHQQWSHWTEYMFKNLTDKNINRWNHQIKTPYNKLTEKEKESDREWAKKVIELLMGMGLLKIGKGYQMSIGELFDHLAIANIKIWHLEERISKLSKSNKNKDKIEMGELVKLIREANLERVAMKEELNLRLEGKTRALNKVEHTKLGRR